MFLPKTLNNFQFATIIYLCIFFLLVEQNLRYVLQRISPMLLLVKSIAFM